MTFLIVPFAVLALNIISTLALPIQASLEIVVIARGCRCARAVLEADAPNSLTPQKITKGTIVGAVLAALLFIFVILAMTMLWNRGWRDNISVATQRISLVAQGIRTRYNNVVDKMRASLARPPSTRRSTTSSPAHHPSRSYMSRSRSPMAQFLPGTRSVSVQSDTLSIAGLLSGPGPAGEIGRSERDSVVEGPASSSVGDLGLQVIVTA
ncbi:uncharacterized protein STEHIDRAFT_157696 [Stereum hirsutum FP-91666 SS1]|uniref:uncharacterized protein n=1 Tax=Stereum hirsutum (strain FP-91666) TaxID=721885 RepID=UPI00044499DA|nr:uncharacterized protein STEHIDRAFT_157696 [Stereum hirsutum FP-91666 SS1]EIM86193.1 hypothetical protein STEHIDRAFT_157696 [Stereum hirsutum FP-91666 SS1]